MGHLIGDKKAVNVTMPAGAFDHGDLFRVAGFTGFLINAVTAADTARVRALEIACNRAWKVKLPAGLTPAVGDRLSWASNTLATFQKGDTNLVTEGTASSDGPVVKVVTAKNAAGYAEVVLCGTK